MPHAAGRLVGLVRFESSRGDGAHFDEGTLKNPSLWTALTDLRVAAASTASSQASTLIASSDLADERQATKVVDADLRQLATELHAEVSRVVEQFYGISRQRHAR